MKYNPCPRCGEKPKSYKEPFNREWHLDHDCFGLNGSCYYVAALTRKELVMAWNKRTKDLKE